MRSRLSSLFAIAILLVGPSEAVRAGTATFGLDQALGGNSNLVQGIHPRQPDGTYEIRPNVTLNENREELNYHFYYGPQYNAYMKTDGINGWSHYLRGNLSYRPTARDEIALRTTVSLEQFVNTTESDGVTAPGQITAGVGDVGRYKIDLDYTRSLTQRSMAGIGGGYEQYTYTNRRNVPSIAGHGRVNAFYQVAPRWQLGVDLRGTYRSFPSTSGRPASSNTVGNSNILARWQAMEGLSVRASGGPAWVRQRQDAPEARIGNRYQFGFDSFGNAYAAPWERPPDAPGESCESAPGSGIYILGFCDIEFNNGTDIANNMTVPPNDPPIFDQLSLSFAPGTQTTSVNSDGATFFASLNVEKKWLTNLRSQLSYVRSQDAAGGQSSTRLSDSVTVGLSYEPFDRTAFNFATAFTNHQLNARQSQGLAVAQEDPANATDAGLLLAEATGELFLSEFDNHQTTKQINVSFVARRRITEHIELSGVFTYADQWTDSEIEFVTPGFDTRISNSRFTRFIGRVWLRIEFDPYRF